MKLYHYSKDKHDVVQSLQARNEEGTDDRLKLDVSGILPPYNTSISFFLNRIPSKLPDILDGKHKFWVPGDLYEYQIDAKDLPEDIVYNIAETPEWVKTTDRYDWSKASDPKVRKQYMDAIRKWSLSQNLIGEGVKDLITYGSRYNGSVGDYYKQGYKLAKRDDELETFFSKYAAYVPHAMLYHDDFKITKFKVQKITLVGKPVLGTETFQNRPPSSNW